MNPIEFTAELKSTYGPNLEAVILYGSAARGEFHEGHSDHNIIVVLRDLSPMELAKPSRAVKKWVKSGNPAPIFFSREIIESAADVFPIEFSGIKEAHRVLYGDDPFGDIGIDMKNLRHQCEFELRSKLLALRQRIPLTCNDERAVLKLILESSSSFFAIFEGVLMLSGEKPRPEKKAMLEQLAKTTGVNPSVFLEILEARTGERSFSKSSAFEKLEQYLTSIEAVVRYADGL